MTRNIFRRRPSRSLPAEGGSGGTAVRTAEDDSAFALAWLRATVAGPVLLPGDPGAEQEAACFNVAVQHRPAVIVGAANAGDVEAAVRYATGRGLPVVVQATGHGPVRPAEGAVLVTTSRMQGVSVDPVARTARAEAGVRWSAVVQAAAPLGLVPLAGSTSQVGVAGYTVGGGIGVLGRQFGFAADHVLAVDLVTADGRSRHVTAENDPELFWAVRGGKGNFGIVTAIEFRLFELAEFYGGGVFFEAGSAAAVLHAWREWAPTLPEASSTSIAFLRMPDLEQVPPPLRGRFVTHLRFSHAGPAADGEALVAPVRAAGEVLMENLGPMPFAAMDAIHLDPTEPMPAWERGGLLRELPAEAADALLAAAGPDVEVPLAVVELRLLGGALGRPAEVPNAVSGREGAFSLLVIGPLVPGLEEVVPAVGHGVHAALARWTTGTALLNFLGDATTPAAVGTAWTPEVLARLVAVRDAVDPIGVFRSGHVLS